MSNKIIPSKEQVKFVINIIESWPLEYRVQLVLRLYAMNSPQEAIQKIFQVDSPIEAAQAALQVSSPEEVILKFIQTEEQANRMTELLRQKKIKCSEK